MLIFISDIHFTDGSAFPSYLPARAFSEVFFSNVSSLLERRTRKKDRSRVKDLKIVLLGDVFDIIRTKEWFDVEAGMWKPKKVTPWTPRKGNVEKRAHDILKRILRENREAVEAIKELPTRLSTEFDLQAELCYVPGNHDRLVAMPSLWGSVSSSLGKVKLLKDGFYKPEGYGTLAFHGHQLDMANREDKGSQPIGDFISSFVTALPYCIEDRMKQKKFPPTTIERFKKRMLMIDDIRPQSAIVQWLVTEAGKENKAIKDLLTDFIFDSIEALLKDEFVKGWIDAHDRELGAKDELLSLISWLSGVFPLRKFVSLEKIASAVNRMRGDGGKDAYAEKLLAASDGEFTRKDPHEYGIQQKMGASDCIVIGHTHGAKYMPLKEKLSYLNTGTWRRYSDQSLAGDRFVPHRSLTFVVVYGRGEAGDRRFEQWSALMKTRGLSEK